MVVFRKDANGVKNVASVLKKLKVLRNVCHRFCHWKNYKCLRKGGKFIFNQENYLEIDKIKQEHSKLYKVYLMKIIQYLMRLHIFDDIKTLFWKKINLQTIILYTTKSLLLERLFLLKY